MKALWSGQLSAAKSGWLIALLFFGWLAYLLVPAPKPEPKPMAPPVKPPPSSLVALGLPDNPDLEHLPQFFALYADQAEWKNDRTVFAYWNPGSNNYSYFFEAIRVGNTFHFRAMPEPHTGDLYVDSSDDSTPEVRPIRFCRSVDAANPSKIHVSLLQRSISTECGPDLGNGKRLEPIKPPQPELKFPSLDLERKK